MNQVIEISTRLNAEMAANERAELVPPTVAPAVAGVYRGMDFLEYARIDAASQSMLSLLQPPSTPAHCLAYRQSAPKKTDALIEGERYHCALLEPEAFETRYVTLGQCEGVTQKKTRCSNSASVLCNGAAFCKTHAVGPVDLTAQVITADEYETALYVRDAVWSHPAARALLERVVDREVSMVWRDDATGEMCKGRIDATVPELGMLVDLKSTRNAGPIGFAQSVRAFGYHRQASMYMDGAVFSGLGDFRRYCFIAFEKVRPFAVAVYRLTDADIIAGGAELAQLLAMYAKCRREDHWPAYSEAIEDISIANLGGASHGDY